LARIAEVRKTVPVQYASLIVLVGSGDMHGIGRAGNDARGDAGSRKFESLEMAVFAGHFVDQGSAIDGHLSLKALWLDSFGVFGEQQVGDDDDRALIFFRKVKGFD